MKPQNILPNRALCLAIQLIEQLLIISVDMFRQQSSSKVRLSRLLLTLVPVSAVDKRGLENLFFQRTLGSVAVDKLVMDLLQVSSHHFYSIQKNLN